MPVAVGPWNRGLRPASSECARDAGAERECVACINPRSGLEGRVGSHEWMPCGKGWKHSRETVTDMPRRGGGNREEFCCGAGGPRQGNDTSRRQMLLVVIVVHSEQTRSGSEWDVREAAGIMSLRARSGGGGPGRTWMNTRSQNWLRDRTARARLLRSLTWPFCPVRLRGGTVGLASRRSSSS